MEISYRAHHPHRAPDLDREEEVPPSAGSEISEVLRDDVRRVERFVVASILVSRDLAEIFTAVRWHAECYAHFLTDHVPLAEVRCT